MIARVVTRCLKSAIREYSRRNPPHIHRCQKCDETAVKLVQRNYRDEHQVEDEVTVLYRCENCNQDLILVVKPSEFVLYV